MKQIVGDLIALGKSGEFDVIIHGCNCFCTMGSGIALGIKKAFPEAFHADLASEKGSKEKLGTFSHATISFAERQLAVVNAYTQFHWKGNGVKADYFAIRAVMQKIKNSFSGQRIGYPLIGAGLAGGDWEKIASIIDEELQGEDHTLVIYDGGS